MPRLLNTEIMSHPLNWVIVFLMITFWLVVINLVWPETNT